MHRSLIRWWIRSSAGPRPLSPVATIRTVSRATGPRRKSTWKFSRDSGQNYSVSNPDANRQKDPRIQLGSVYPSNRLALVRAKRSVTALRRAIGIGHDNAAVGRQYLLREIRVDGEEIISQYSRYSNHFRLERKSATADLTSTTAILPFRSRSITSTLRPVLKVNLVM